MLQNPRCSQALLALLITATTLTVIQPASADVFNPGPDDPSLFDTVINVPADQASISGSFGNISGAASPTVQINVSDGGTVVSSFSNRFSIYGGGEVNITGGSVGTDLAAYDGSEINISGGTVGDELNAFSGSTVNISGGSIGPFSGVFNGGVINISGGTIATDFFANAGGEVNLFGTEFFLNGVPMNALVLGQTTVVPERNQELLTGSLADGTAFSFLLNPNSNHLQNTFQNGSTLTVTLVPEPSSLAVVAMCGLALARRRRRV